MFTKAIVSIAVVASGAAAASSNPGGQGNGLKKLKNIKNKLLKNAGKKNKRAHAKNSSRLVNPQNGARQNNKTPNEGRILSGLGDLKKINLQHTQGHPDGRKKIETLQVLLDEKDAALNTFATFEQAKTAPKATRSAPKAKAGLLSFGQAKKAKAKAVASLDLSKVKFITTNGPKSLPNGRNSINLVDPDNLARLLESVDEEAVEEEEADEIIE